MLIKKKYVQADHELPYLFHAPKQAGHETAGWPLVLFLHGAGERGTDLTKVTDHGFAMKMTEPDYQEAPFIFVAPQCAEDSYWTEELQIVSDLLEEIMVSYPVDERRIYLTGLSMGAIGSWHLALKYPNRFAAMVPVCGSITLPAHRLEEFPQILAKDDIWKQLHVLKDLPIWAFHGEADDVVPVDETAEIIDFLKQFNDHVQLTIYPEVGHDSWVPAFEDPRLYAWLFKQGR
ncbi:carboxylesterase family protein [Gracilibacillus alcaliphilus]|uniref:carboxylesterase family protein n=1 Tax=Gracilibacillus alcaliphilus TaxID=1401441 RepID=UPI00195E7114|nr:alpha/beta fold hydrolase [Gracilibacillus alcaliphilus]MBM7677426.1 putative peptidase [Gracilibacillus alcaliphilus]